MTTAALHTAAAQPQKALVRPPRLGTQQQAGHTFLFKVEETSFLAWCPAQETELQRWSQELLIPAPVWPLCLGR